MTRVLPPARLALSFAVLLGAAACKPAATSPGAAPGAGEKPVDPPPLVRVERLELRPVRRTIETTSYLESDHAVTLLSKVAGRVQEVSCDEGQHVRVGQPLAQLDDREARASKRQIEVQLQDRRVRLDLAELESKAAEQRVSQARIERDKAKAQHERNLQIDPGLISEKELEDGKFALDSAEEAHQVAIVLAKKAELEVVAARNTIDELTAKLESEQIKLDEHTIKAPFEGVVAERHIRGGETIGLSTELFVVVDEDNLVAHLSRPQRELETIRGAKEVTFTTDAVPDHEFRAAIDLIAPTVDQATGSFRIRVRVHRDDDLADVLRPGMFIRATILAEDQREALMVPKAAVVNEGAQAVVFVVRDGVARRVVLQQGIEERSHVECVNRGADGLVPGDEVVVSGQQSLVDSAEVEVARD